MQKKGVLCERFFRSYRICFVTAVLCARISSGNETGEGKKLYIAKCQICHGIKGDGDGSAAAYLASKPGACSNPKLGLFDHYEW